MPIHKKNPFILEPSWQKVLLNELNLSYIFNLATFVNEQRAGNYPIYPPEDLTFEALNKTPFDKVKVVIVGQDPYHRPLQAHGLCFSVPEGVSLPPSLRNIFKELVSDIGCPFPKNGCLTYWAEQGVLLLNTTLTVRQGKPMSHFGMGWERFTDAIISILNEKKNSLIFVLWGKHAKQKCRHIHPHHHVLTAAHPSPLSAYNGFFGCTHFSQINDLLKKEKKTPINWQLN